MSILWGFKKCRTCELFFSESCTTEHAEEAERENIDFNKRMFHYLQNWNHICPTHQDLYSVISNLFS